MKPKARSIEFAPSRPWPFDRSSRRIASSDTISILSRTPERQRSFSGGASPEPWDPADEVSDEELLECMTRAGCFDWLADPAEDIYTLGDGEPL